MNADTLTKTLRRGGWHKLAREVSDDPDASLWEGRDYYLEPRVRGSRVAVYATPLEGGGEPELVADDAGYLYTKRPVDEPLADTIDTRRKVRNIRLSDAELDTLREAATLSGSRGWSTWLRNIGMGVARRRLEGAG